MLNCKACNKSTLEKFVKNVNRCISCGSLFIETSTSKKFPSIAVEENRIKLQIQKKTSMLVAESYLKFLKQKTNFNFKRALDIGAGFGHFVNELNKHGIESYGIESDETTVKYADSNITHEFFDEQYNSELKYDLISLNQCLYYFNDSFSILKKLESMLENDGVLFIATVNPESEFRLQNKIWTQGCKMCLSKQVFKNLNNYGLRLEDVTSYDDNVYIEYFLHKKGKMTDIKFWKNLMLYLLKMKKIIKIKDNGVDNFILLRKTANQLLG